MDNGKKEQLIKTINKLVLEGENVLATKRSSAYVVDYIDSGKFNAWRDKVLIVIDNSRLDIPQIVNTIKNLNPEYPGSVSALRDSLQSIIELLDLISFDEKTDIKIDCICEIENIFNKFHKIARQLRSRHNNQPTLDVKDEYDVQDLLHALLLLHFDDVRVEEWTPSYAGGACRMDFLLKDYNIVIETKKTRDSMTAKQLGEELLIDREKYKTSANCKQLYCFVYDPEGHLGNPSGIKKDLEKDNEEFLKVFIKPE